MFVAVSVLFSEPKIPQFGRRDMQQKRALCFSALQRAENSSMRRDDRNRRDRAGAFQCSSASRKFLNYRATVATPSRATVSVLFSEPKIPQYVRKEHLASEYVVSVLFSEPKIPQLWTTNVGSGKPLCFSALQRAENSSIARRIRAGAAVRMFQCSSASRKFLNTSRSSRPSSARKVSVLFSEPKIPQSGVYIAQLVSATEFQCSSASRKFLNLILARNATDVAPSFSALQRAENSSIFAAFARRPLLTPVSVLFSEPKIPQSRFGARSGRRANGFSALQRAENSSMSGRTGRSA